MIDSTPGSDVPPSDDSAVESSARSVDPATSDAGAPPAPDVESTPAAPVKKPAPRAPRTPARTDGRTPAGAAKTAAAKKPAPKRPATTKKPAAPRKPAAKPSVPVEPSTEPEPAAVEPSTETESAAVAATPDLGVPAAAPAEDAASTDAPIAPESEASSDVSASAPTPPTPAPPVLPPDLDLIIPPRPPLPPKPPLPPVPPVIPASVAPPAGAETTDPDDTVEIQRMERPSASASQRVAASEADAVLDPIPESTIAIEPEPESAPVAPPESARVESPAPPTADLPAAAPEPEHVPAEPVLAPEPESELLPAAEPESEPELALEPETAGEPEPQPVASPESDAAAVPSLGAEPLAEPAVEPALEFRQDPDPDPEPEPERAAAVSAPAVTAERGAPADASDRTEATADAGEEPALRVSGLRKSFGATTAVGGIDLVVPAGSFYGLVGPNGAGKTTTLSMIAGLLRPDAGSIRIAGLDARAKSRQAKRLVGVLPDRLRTFDRLTGRQLLSYSGLLRGLSSSTVESRVADLGRAFDLTQALGRPVSDYSAGMTKKVMLAGAMIHSPRLLVLDEPFEAVDPVSSAVILDILSTYVEHGGTVLLSSHGMELVERVCTRVAVMVAGQVLAAGTVDEVRGQRTLEERFLELIGGSNEVEGLEWLHTFSD